MPIPVKQLKHLREELENCTNPLYFFDDDPDGLCSFLLFYRYNKEGKGVIVKSTPELGVRFFRSIDMYEPDKIFILDKPRVHPDFIEKLKTPTFWLDHHQPQDPDKIHYFNPMIKDNKDNRPTSYWAYQVVKQDLWVATAGCISDWFIPDFIKEFQKKYPKLLKKIPKTPEEVLFNTKLGKFCRILSFILKGQQKDTMKCVKTLTRIKTPYEIMDQSTPAGKFIYKRYKKVNQEYEPLINSISKKNIQGKILLFKYTEKTMSFTSDLSNELLYKYPKKVIIIAREKSGEMKCSLRASFLNLPPILEKALVNIDGYGGGHEHACGACVNVNDFERFIKRIKKEIK